ncbi:hypothetical protein LTR70_000133 [Exophiala xenobiotica]|uniref:AB hydrolase-1 domain-containing protein n=1 Tax=Lithohypha guttulata TaxID=1690604 RepID=A0ABR0KQB1_9EURO|nr:hypothetical protein LTR24_000258 [Lithohypha guttulata]KAK5330811.1 hypothetical protein LTR70_000133 [Exophiala xenobiotica]
MLQMKSATFSLADAAKGTQDVLTVEVITPSLADPDKSRAAVLFLPFWGGSASTFNQVITHLEGSHLQSTCLFISYAGTGNTPAPMNDAAKMHSIIPRARQLKCLLQEPEIRKLTSKRLIICAHSMSAKIAYHLLTLLDHEQTQPTNLILLGPAPVGPLILPPDMQQQQLQAYQTQESAAWTIENVLTARTGKLGSDVVAELAKDCASMSPGAKRGWPEYGMAVDCSEIVKEVRSKWSQLSVKILVGSEDKVETVERVTEGTVIPLQNSGFDVELSVIDTAGHLLPAEAPVAVLDAVLVALGDVGMC